MSFERPGLLALAVGLLGLVAPSAQAGELDRCFAEMRNPLAQRQQAGAAQTPSDLDATTQGELQPIEDFHPETDRWTERTNRIRISPFVGVWWFSGELDIRQDIAIGARIAWEVPGFIGIRLDHAIVPWAKLEVKGARPNNGRSSRQVDGFVHSHTLSLGIFNPELSIDGLAFWAGFGAGLWFYNFHESDVFSQDSGIDADWDDTNFAFNIFVELDYKITDIIHVGVGFREHIVFASHTDDGRFYEFNGVEQSGNNDGRNDGILDDLATVTELTFTVSVLF